MTQSALRRTLKSRIPLFWLVCAIGTLGPWACAVREPAPKQEYRIFYFEGGLVKETGPGNSMPLGSDMLIDYSPEQALAEFRRATGLDLKLEPALQQEVDSGSTRTVTFENQPVGAGSLPSVLSPDVATVPGNAIVHKAEICAVESVYDGDTIWVSCNGKREKIRLFCIDAPEMQQKPWGEQSRDHLRGLLGPTVGVERLDTDRYGRTVAKLWTGDDDTTLRMVRDGWAVVYEKYCPRYTEGSYYDWTEHASSARVGVWSEDGLQSEPWTWRANTK